MTEAESIAWEKLLGRTPTALDIAQINTMESVFGYAYGAIDASWSVKMQGGTLLLDTEEAWAKADRPENIEENMWRKAVPLPVKVVLLFSMLKKGIQFVLNPALQARWNELMDLPYVALPDMKLPEPFAAWRVVFFDKLPSLDSKYI